MKNLSDVVEKLQSVEAGDDGAKLVYWADWEGPLVKESREVEAVRFETVDAGVPGENKFLLRNVRQPLARLGGQQPASRPIAPPDDLLAVVAGGELGLLCPRDRCWSG